MTNLGVDSDTFLEFERGGPKPVTRGIYQLDTEVLACKNF